MRRGFILWIVLATIALLGSTLIGIAQLARIELKHSQSVRARRQAAAYARFAARLALRQIAENLHADINVVGEDKTLNAHYNINADEHVLLDPKTQCPIGRYKVQLTDHSLQFDDALGLLLTPSSQLKTGCLQWLHQNEQWPEQLRSRNIAPAHALRAFVCHNYTPPCTEPIAIGPIIRRIDWHLTTTKKSSETLTLIHTFTLYLHNPYPIALPSTAYHCGIRALANDVAVATLSANTGERAEVYLNTVPVQKIQTAFNPGEHHIHTWNTTQTVRFKGNLNRLICNGDASIVLYVADNNRHFYNRQHVRLVLHNSPHLDLTYDIGAEDPEHCNPRSTQIEPWAQHHFKVGDNKTHAPTHYNPWVLFDIPKNGDTLRTLASLRHAPLCLEHLAPMYGVGSCLSHQALREFLYDHFYLPTSEHRTRTDLHADVDVPYVRQPFNINNHHAPSWGNFLKQAFGKHPPERCPWSHARPQPHLSAACIDALAQHCAQTAKLHGPFKSIAQFLAQLEPQWAPILRQNFGENLNFGDCSDSFCHRLTTHSDCIAADVEAETFDVNGQTTATCRLTAIFQRTYARDARGNFSWRLRKIVHH